MDLMAYLLTWIARHVAAVGTLGLGVIILASVRRNGPIDRTHLAFGCLITTQALAMWWYVVANLHVASDWREHLFTWAWIGWTPYLLALGWLFLRLVRRWPNR